MVAPGIGLEFGDSPSAANTLVRTYTSFKQDFELCAVCIYGGLEGPLVDMGSVGATTGLILTRMAVYGCVKWGHKVTTSKTTRYIEHDIVTGPSPQSVNVGGKYPGSAPSAEWKKVVTEQFPALYPAIVKHYGAG
jgi:hypothetical protein